MSPEQLNRLRAFIFERWQTRAVERGLLAPTDLSGACKFASLFVRELYGGEIRGNWHHQFNVLDGAIVDLCADARDVQATPDPYRHDPRFFGNPEHLESMASCMPRVRRWVAEFKKGPCHE